MNGDNYQLIFGDSWGSAIAGLTSNRRKIATGILRRNGTSAMPSLLVDPLRVVENITGDDYRPLDHWIALAMPGPNESLQPEDWLRRLRPWRSQLLAILLIGLGDRNEGWLGWTYERERLTPLAGIQVRGASPLMFGREDDPVVAEQWSRTIGAVGERAFHKIRQSTATIVGASRLGSMVAWQLSCVGIRRLRLIDPDRVEAHNVPGMPGIDRVSIGEFKVLALADTLTKHRPDLAVTAIPQDALAPTEAYADSELLVTAVDRDAARLKIALAAKEHGTVHLDVGTGVTMVDGSKQLAGDCRLLLPGQGCVCCVGGLVDYDQAFYELHAPRGSLPRRPPEAWNARGRLGSSATFNGLTAATAVQMWIDYLNGERISTSWLRLNWDGIGGLKTVGGYVLGSRICPVCQRRESVRL